MRVNGVAMVVLMIAAAAGSPADAGKIKAPFDLDSVRDAVRDVKAGAASQADGQSQVAAKPQLVEQSPAVKSWANPAVASDSTGRLFMAWNDNTVARGLVLAQGFIDDRWRDLGPTSAPGRGLAESLGCAFSPSVAADQNGGLVVVWYDDSAGVAQVFAKHFDGTRWSNLGRNSSSGMGVSATASGSSQPRVAIDGQGRPVVVWQEFMTFGDWSIYVKRFDGKRWVELGTGATTGHGMSGPYDSRAPSLIIDRQGRPVIAWQQYNLAAGGYNIYVKRFDGTKWVELGKGSATLGGVSRTPGRSGQPVLSLDGQGRPVVVWQDDSAGVAQIYARRFDGETWQEMGQGSASGSGVSATSGKSIRPSVAVGSDGRPIVVWVDSSSGVDQIYVKRFDGRKWTSLGRGSSIRGGVSDTQVDSGSPSVALDRRGRPIVVWHDEIKVSTRRIVVKRFDGSRWRTLESPQRVGGSHLAPAVERPAPAAKRSAPPVKRSDKQPSLGSVARKPVPSRHTQMLPAELAGDRPTTLAIKLP